MPLMRALALLSSLLGATAYTTPNWKHASTLMTQTDSEFDASTCKSLSGSKKDDTWCVASCGAPIKPDCPSNFCKCEGEVPYDSAATDAGADRDAEVAKRDADIADRGGGWAGATGPDFDASKCVALSGKEKDTTWCIDSCGAPVKPECPANFCSCEQDEDAVSEEEIAAAEIVSGFDASTCKSLSGTEKDDAWCVASCGAPIKPDCPSSMCKCEGEVPYDSSVTDTGSERDAEVAKRDTDIANRGGGAGAETDAELTDADADVAGAEFDASTCVSLSGTEKDNAWCVASCGAPIKPDCPSTVCKCEGEVPYDSAKTDVGSDRDAEVAKRDADIANRGGGPAADRDAEVAKRDADIASRGAAGATAQTADGDADTAFDASTCRSLSGTTDDDAWCVSSCGAPMKPDCPSTFCACEGEVPYDSSKFEAGEARDAEIAKRDASLPTDDPTSAAAQRDADIAKRDADIASRGDRTVGSDSSTEGSAALTLDPLFDGSTCHKLNSKGESDDKWCKEHCSMDPPDCPASQCYCDKPELELPPNPTPLPAAAAATAFRLGSTGGAIGGAKKRKRGKEES